MKFPGDDSIFPQEEEPTQEAAPPTEGEETSEQETVETEEPEGEGVQAEAAPTDGEQAEQPQVEPQRPVPQQPQYDPVQLLQQQQQQAAQERQWYMQQVAQALQQGRQPPPPPEEPLTPEKYWEDPVTATQKIVQGAVQQAWQQGIAPMQQQYVQDKIQQANREISSTIQDLKTNPQTKSYFDKYGQEFESTLTAMYNQQAQYGPQGIVGLGQREKIREVFNWVVGRHAIGQPTQPVQPPLAQDVPSVGTKVSAPKPTGKAEKVELTEEERREAKRQGLSDKEYRYWQGREYA